MFTRYTNDIEWRRTAISDIKLPPKSLVKPWDDDTIVHCLSATEHPDHHGLNVLTDDAARLLATLYPISIDKSSTCISGFRTLFFARKILPDDEKITVGFLNQKLSAQTMKKFIDFDFFCTRILFSHKEPEATAYLAWTKLEKEFQKALSGLLVKGDKIWEDMTQTTSYKLKKKTEQ